MPNPHAHNDAPADARPNNWVDAYAPAFTVPFLRLMRADRPVGIWLLLWPCYFGLALALIDHPRAMLSLDTGVMVVLFAIGAIVMRGAGCTYNDIADRDFDAKVARTALRPIPAGQVSVRAAMAFLVILCLIGLVIVLQFNPITIILAIASLGLVAIYPFMKRITYWPQLWLGLTFNWGALIGFSALNGGISLAAILIYGAGIFWTLGYDTIYAHQDREDDALIGVKSTALRLGGATKIWLMGFYGTVIAGFIGAGMLVNFSPLAWFALIPAAAHFAWQIRTLDINDPHKCLSVFKTNRNAGFLLLLPLLAQIAVRLNIGQ